MFFSFFLISFFAIVFLFLFLFLCLPISQTIFFSFSWICISTTCDKFRPRLHKICTPKNLSWRLTDRRTRGVSFLEILFYLLNFLPSIYLQLCMSIIDSYFVRNLCSQAVLSRLHDFSTNFLASDQLKLLKKIGGT